MNLNKPKTMAEFVADSLRKDILLGKIPGGTRLKQDEISELLSVSATPVREAIKILSAQGLVNFDAYRGAVVKNLSYKDAKDIYDIRLMLEPILIKRSLEKFDEIYLKKAISIQNDIDKCTNPYDWAILNSAFHSTFWEVESDSKLYDIVQNLLISSIPYITITLMHKQDHIALSDDEHLAIINAYKSRDEGLLIELNSNHTMKTRDILEDAINA
ncbi:GntR family transcriptional regulator [Campylobacter geochelonis]|uniref:GntR family transcriptional regulator n=1 Tax=Campylobacter geochelonis TaxID=1780362 RepID=UPI000770891A|nr:GntR family transcriptional regulator [Campylobacter geochelonis]CZE47443.1 glycosyltransferase [Campylobacter geochelonis]